MKPGELRRGKTFTRDLDVTKAELKSRVDDGQPLSAGGGGGIGAGPAASARRCPEGGHACPLVHGAPG